MAPILGTLRAARGPAGPAPGPSWALATSQPVSTLYTAHMSCHGGGLESSPLSRLPVLHRSSVRGLVERHCAREGRLGQKVEMSSVQPKRANPLQSPARARATPAKAPRRRSELVPLSPARSPWAAVKAAAAGAAATLSASAAGVFGSPSRAAPVFGSPSNSSPVACPSSAPRQLNFGDATLPTAVVGLGTTAKLVRADASLAEVATFLCAGAQSFEVGCVAESPGDPSLPRRALEWRHCVEHRLGAASSVRPTRLMLYVLGL